MPIPTLSSETGGQAVTFSLDAAGRWKAISADWLTLTGLDPQGCTGRDFADSLHADDRAHSRHTVRGVLRGELLSCRLPVRCLGADGRSIWVELAGFPTLDTHGRIDGLTGTLMDVTDRRRGMRALRESEARFRAISEASPLGVSVTDTKGRVVYSNPVLRALADMDPDDQDGYSQGLTIDPEDRPRVLRQIDQATHDKQPFQSEFRYRHRDGANLWCRLHAAPILDGQQLLGYVHVSEDVTAAHLGEQALRVSQERLRLALEGSGVALMDMDLRTGEIFLSEQWGRFTGEPYRQSVVTMTQFVERVHEEDQERLQLAFKETISGQRPYLRMDYRIQTESGQWKWIETHARIVDRTAEGEPLRLTGTHADITERKDLERLQAEFVATVSHELRTPLTSILGALEVVLENPGDGMSQEGQRFLNVAYRNSERLFDLVNDILDLEKVERGLQTFDFGAVGVRSLLVQVMDLHEAVARRRSIELYIETVDEDLEVWADGERLIQVMNNLLSNAIKFSPDESRVLLRVEDRGQTVRLEVVDSGPGIAQSFQGRIFQRFAQAEQDRRQSAGSGLGLSICKALVEKMDGQIGFRSGKNAGTTFFVELPRRGRVDPAVKTGTEQSHA